VPAEPLISYAQNAEDVVLWRALGGLREGIYVDVGGYDPDDDSVTRLFYERGWRGITVEPVPEFAERFRERRPRDELVEAAVTDLDVDKLVLHRFGSTGLSTVVDGLATRHDDAGFEHTDLQVPAITLDAVLEQSSAVREAIHFLKVDVEGAEDQVLRSVDLKRWKPWVLVIEATEPNSTSSAHETWEPLVLAAGYHFTLFDGLSRFYVSDAHPELAAALSYPACILDGYSRAREVDMDHRAAELQATLAQAHDDAMRWRNNAVTYWSESVARVQRSEAAIIDARQEANRLRRRLTKLRDKAEESRTERRRLRAKVKRLELRIERLTTKVESLQALEEAASRSPRNRLRRLAGRIRKP